MRALSKQLTQKWPEALWRLGQRAWAPFSRDTATRLRLPLSGECHPGTVYLVGAGSGTLVGAGRGTLVGAGRGTFVGAG